MQDAEYRDGRSAARNGSKNGRPSTAPLVANRENCLAAAKLLLLKDEEVAVRCFEGEALERMLGVVRWALWHDNDPQGYDPNGMIERWERKRKCGVYSDRPTRGEQIVHGDREPDVDLDGDRENERLARELLRYWTENPLRFVAVLDEVEAAATGKNGSRS